MSAIFSQLVKLLINKAVRLPFYVKGVESLDNSPPQTIRRLIKSSSIKQHWFARDSFPPGFYIFLFFSFLCFSFLYDGATLLFVHWAMFQMNPWVLLALSSEGPEPSGDKNNNNGFTDHGSRIHD